jgi:hypothetical protein
MADKSDKCCAARYGTFFIAARLVKKALLTCKIGKKGEFINTLLSQCK